MENSIEDKFAHKVFISLIKSPLYSNLDQLNQQQLDKDLNKHFNQSYKFKLNDHFEIKSYNSECKLS